MSYHRAQEVQGSPLVRQLRDQHNLLPPDDNPLDPEFPLVGPQFVRAGKTRGDQDEGGHGHGGCCNLITVSRSNA